MKRDYYETLNIDRGADDQTIKKAFRRLAMEYHPDRNSSKEATSKFQELQEAYDVLSDPQKKSLYDQFGHDGLRGQAGGFGRADDIFAGFQSIFDDFFGSSSSARQARGSDLLFRLDLDFREAVLGCTKTIQVQRHDVCEDCEGTGAEPGTSPEPCPLCKGRGKIGRNQGFFVISQTCPQCSGAGKIIRNRCEECKGQGRIRSSQSLEVHVPAGVDTGIRLRMTHEGDLPEHGAQRGDLYVEIHVRPDEIFERDGIDLYTMIRVPFPTAVLGGEIKIKLLEGEKSVKVPKGMKSPYRHILKNEGVKDLNRNRRGDLIVEMQIETPENLSSKAKDLIEQLQDEIGQAPSQSESPHRSKKKKKGFFS